ncbi:sensory histidine kinase DcuS [Clostridiales bacterium CHKCI001]|nr:sensory histidine kinase DcuS [Clostridiales bacterium CHKCI001]
MSKDFRQHIKVLSNRSKLKFSLQSSKNARKSRAGRDNQLIFHQYTYSTSQPANGILVLTNEDIENDPLRFLCRGWCFYPDELLTPKDFAQANPSEYMVYRNIGEQTNFASNYNVTPHGCATYVLHLFLPDTEASYSLESPEIYSAYRLYINEALILEVGNQDPDSSQPLTQNRMITFKAAGMTTILLAVSDYSHFYSGLVYPPAFGTTLALNITRFIRLCISVIICTSSLIIGLLSIYFGIHTKHPSSWLFALLCACTGISHSYILVHSLFALPIFPWYGLEIFFIYITTLLIIILQNRICNIPKRFAFISNSICVLFASFSLFYGLSSSSLTVPFMQQFSRSLVIFKAIVAVYLLITTFFSIFKLEKKTFPLINASIFYGSAFLWDRLLPDYEPIYGGCFAEWGSLIFVFAIGYTLWNDMVQGYSYGILFAEQNRQMSKQLAMQVSYSQQIQEQIESNRKLNHDFRHHLRVLNTIAQESNDKNILNYLKEIDSFVQTNIPTTPISFCNHPTVDALLRYYYSFAKENQIEISLQIAIPENLPLSDIELCSILGNLLENAIEACLRQSDPPRSITLKTHENKFTFFLLIENTYNGRLEKQNDRFISQKNRTHSRFGIGIESVRGILNHYHGTMDIYPEQLLFKIGITLPLSK